MAAAVWAAPAPAGPLAIGAVVALGGAVYLAAAVVVLPELRRLAFARLRPRAAAPD